MLNRFQFEILKYIEHNNLVKYSARDISMDLLLSASAAKKTIEELLDKNYISCTNNVINITCEGLELLEMYRVKKAVIMAAGFGSRMMPATTDKPKPMVTVNGIRIIDTLIDSFTNIGINDITIVRGYKKEAFDKLLDKYPFIKFLDNEKYKDENNISSAITALNEIDNCYLCEADLYISNPNIIEKYQYTSNILGSYSLETDDWSFQMDENGYITNYKKGNINCYNYYGISFWTKKDSEQLRNDWLEVYKTDKGVFWEEVPLIIKKNNYNVEIRQCSKKDIVEIDNYYELCELDSSYK